MYVIGCNHLHAILGPFETWEEAETLAIMETERSPTECVWITIPFYQVQKPKKKNKMPEQSERGYL